MFLVIFLDYISYAIFYKLSRYFYSHLYSVHAQNNPLVVNDSLAQQKWVDATVRCHVFRRKIGQLFMVSVTSNQNKSSSDKIKALIQNHHIGGVIFSTGGPVRRQIDK